VEHHKPLHFRGRRLRVVDHCTQKLSRFYASIDQSRGQCQNVSMDMWNVEQKWRTGVFNRVELRVVLLFSFLTKLTMFSVIYSHDRSILCVRISRVSEWWMLDYPSVCCGGAIVLLNCRGNICNHLIDLTSSFEVLAPQEPCFQKGSGVRLVYYLADLFYSITIGYVLTIFTVLSRKK